MEAATNVAIGTCFTVYAAAIGYVVYKVYRRYKADKAYNAAYVKRAVYAYEHPTKCTPVAYSN